MQKRKNNYKSAKKKKFNLNINIKKISIFVIIFFILSYFVYVTVNFINIKSVNPLNESSTGQYLLTQNPNSFKKTLIVFEDRYGEDQDKIERVFLYAENKEKEAAILIHIPNWILYSGTETNSGNAIAVSSFKYAGEFVQSGKGIEFALWKLEELLGMKVDQYIWFDASAFNLLQENLGEVSNNTAYSQYFQNGSSVSEDVFFLNSFVSNLNWSSLIFSSGKFKNREATIYSSLYSLPHIIVEMKNIHNSILRLKPFVIDLGTSAYIDSKEYEGGGIQNYINLFKYDATWRENTSRMIDKGLEKERVRVEVYNASGISGLASSFARKIANSGCEVVRFDNAPNKEEFTKFFIPNSEDFKESTNVVRDIFPGQYESINSRPSFMTTGDIVIILGENITSMYSF